MSRDSNMRHRGYDWYPDDPELYRPKLCPDLMEPFLAGWNRAKADSENEELAEREEYEELRTQHDRWEYLKAKYGEE